MSKKYILLLVFTVITCHATDREADIAALRDFRKRERDPMLHRLATDHYQTRMCEEYAEKFGNPKEQRKQAREALFKQALAAQDKQDAELKIRYEDEAIESLMKSGDTHKLQALLNQGLSPNRIISGRTTPLLYAARTPAQVRLLLRAGAQVAIMDTDQYFRTIGDYYCQYHREDNWRPTQDNLSKVLLYYEAGLSRLQRGVDAERFLGVQIGGVNNNFLNSSVEQCSVEYYFEYFKVLAGMGLAGIEAFYTDDVQLRLQLDTVKRNLEKYQKKDSSYLEKYYKNIGDAIKEGDAAYHAMPEQIAACLGAVLPSMTGGVIRLIASYDDGPSDYVRVKLQDLHAQLDREEVEQQTAAVTTQQSAAQPASKPTKKKKASTNKDDDDENLSDAVLCCVQ